MHNIQSKGVFMQCLIPKADLIAQLKAKIEAAKTEDKKVAKRLENLLKRAMRAPEVAFV
jgi:hypothetical protein